jgi:hypothetical protein
MFGLDSVGDRDILILSTKFRRSTEVAPERGFQVDFHTSQGVTKSRAHSPPRIPELLLLALALDYEEVFRRTRRSDQGSTQRRKEGWSPCIFIAPGDRRSVLTHCPKINMPAWLLGSDWLRRAPVRCVLGDRFGDESVWEGKLT